ncbi:MAG TPA: hypothetical protein VFC41_07945 [Anaerovoracaceae bacterium]|nr:hypothetical protein [Anaerovoracaceae bacterium]
MDSESVWLNIVVSVAIKPHDIHTVPRNARAPLWFHAYITRGRLYVENSTAREPSTKISVRREITYEDVDIVYSYYHRWLNGEKNIRHEVGRLSRNTAYILALISKFENIQPPWYEI